MWTASMKRERLALMRQMGICTRCQRGATKRYALCIRCRQKEAARWRRTRKAQQEAA